MATTPVPVKRGNSSYYVYEIPDFLSHAECDEIIALALSRGMQRSEIYGGAKDLVDDASRNSYTAWIPDGVSPLVDRISALTAGLTGIPVECQEDLQVLRYPAGGYFKPHYDCCEGSEAECARMNGTAGPRHITVILYLNDVHEGGDTAFPNIGISVQPQKGKAAVFWSTDVRGNILEMALHGGNPVQRGEKWVCNKWVHPKPYK